MSQLLDRHWPDSAGIPLMTVCSPALKEVSDHSRKRMAKHTVHAESTPHPPLSRKVGRYDVMERKEGAIEALSASVACGRDDAVQISATMAFMSL